MRNWHTLPTGQVLTKLSIDPDKGLSYEDAGVLRSGQWDTTRADHPVSGDAVRLRAGDQVPADARLPDSAGLRADESVLTGEALALSRPEGPALPDEPPPGDRTCMLAAAAAQGRGVSPHIRKAIHYFLSCSVGETLTLFAAALLDLGQMPLTPVQILWLNLAITPLPALALGAEPVYDLPPRRPDAPLFDRPFTLRLLCQGTVAGAVTLGAYFLGLRLLSGPGAPERTAGTMAFSTLALCQLLHAYDVRGSGSLFETGFLSSRAISRAFAGGLLLLAAVFLPPLERPFSVSPLSPAAWGAVLVLALLPTGARWAVRGLSRGKRRGRRLVRHIPKRFTP